MCVFNLKSVFNFFNKNKIYKHLRQILTYRKKNKKDQQETNLIKNNGPSAVYTKYYNKTNNNNNKNLILSCVNIKKTK